MALGIMSEDGSGTPKVSPLTVSSTALELAVPADATKLVMKAVGADLRFGDNSDLDGTATLKGYFLLLDGATITLEDLDNSASIYVLRNAAVDVTLHFTFMRK